MMQKRSLHGRNTLKDATMITLIPVTRSLLPSVLRLQVGETQRHLVADAATTIAEVAYEPGAEAMVIIAHGEAIGLIALVDPARAIELDPDDPPGTAELWRFMIDAGYQRKGYGTAALMAAKDTAVGWGCRHMSLYVSTAEDSAKRFYLARGFSATGRRLGEQTQLLCSLSP